YSRVTKRTAMSRSLGSVVPLRIACKFALVSVYVQLRTEANFLAGEKERILAICRRSTSGAVSIDCVLIMISDLFTCDECTEYQCISKVISIPSFFVLYSSEGSRPSGSEIYGTRGA